MPQPSGNLPDWDSSNTNVLEPSAGLKSTGWATNAIPTSGNLNWLFKKTSEWLTYLKNFQAEALTWTAAHIHSAAVTFNAATAINAMLTLAHDFIANGQSGDTNPAIQTTAVPTARKLLWRIRVNTGSPNVFARLYATATSGFEVTLNAAWDGTQWVPDTTGAASSKFLLEGAKVLFASAEAGPANFTNAALETRQFKVDLGALGSTFATGLVLGTSKTAGTVIQPIAAANRPAGTQISGGAFLNGWAATSGFTVYFYMDNASETRLWGCAENSAGGGGQALPIFNIPSGQGRPGFEINIPVACQQGGNPFVYHRLKIATNGDVSVPDLPDNTNWKVHLSGVTFPAGSPP